MSKVKEIVVLSGKGGTGKTSIATVCAANAQNAVITDCDVDAANMHIILRHTKLKTTVLSGLPAARIDTALCTRCGACSDHCRFGAIAGTAEKTFAVNDLKCEGCGVCGAVCPAHAVTMRERAVGEWYHSHCDAGDLIHAALYPGLSNSGKMVTAIRSYARNVAMENGRRYIITDGAPGIACPVIAALTGAEAALIVTEPTVSGVHDMERLLQLLHHFRTRAYCVINKSDINENITSQIRDVCAKNDIAVIAAMPYTTAVPGALAQGKMLHEIGGTIAAAAMAVWKSVEEILA